MGPGADHVVRAAGATELGGEGIDVAAVEVRAFDELAVPGGSLH